MILHGTKLVACKEKCFNNSNIPLTASQNCELLPANLSSAGMSHASHLSALGLR